MPVRIPSVKSLPLLGVKWADLFRNTKIRETVVELLTQQYEMARIQEAKEIPSVKILDPASTPEKKNPARLPIVFIGTLLGIVLACAGLPGEELVGSMGPGRSEASIAGSRFSWRHEKRRFHKRHFAAPNKKARRDIAGINRR